MRSTVSSDEVIYAKGFVVPKDGKFVAGVLMEVGGHKLDMLADEEPFDTYDECEAFLVQELPSIVERLCSELGLKVVRSTFFSVNDKKVH